MHIMIEVVRPMLEGIRNGLQQIVPKELLDPLNAEVWLYFVVVLFTSFSMQKINLFINFDNLYAVVAVRTQQIFTGFLRIWFIFA